MPVQTGGALAMWDGTTWGVRVSVRACHSRSSEGWHSTSNCVPGGAKAREAMRTSTHVGRRRLAGMAPREACARDSACLDSCVGVRGDCRCTRRAGRRGVWVVWTAVFRTRWCVALVRCLLALSLHPPPSVHSWSRDRTTTPHHHDTTVSPHRYTIAPSPLHIITPPYHHTHTIITIITIAPSHRHTTSSPHHRTHTTTSHHHRTMLPSVAQHACIVCMSCFLGPRQSAFDAICTHTLSVTHPHRLCG